MSNALDQDSNSALDAGSLTKLSELVWITCNCASNLDVCITRLPWASLLSKSTVLSPAATALLPEAPGVVGGAIVIASRKKSRKPVPNLISASSAASSARCRSLSRLAASPLIRARTVSSSSAPAAAGGTVGVAAASFVVDEEDEENASAWAVVVGPVPKDKLRVWLTMVFLRPDKLLVAS